MSNGMDLQGRGRVYRRCACRSEVTGRQLGARCPGWVDPDHGRWYSAAWVEAVDGSRARIRKGGFDTRAQAERACLEVLALPGPRAVARTWTVRRWLELWLAQIETYRRPTTVASYRNGRPVRPDWLTRRFAQLVAELDLPPVRLHDLRHLAASIAGAAGVDLKVIQHQLGHSSPVTTAETYRIVFRQTAQAAVRASAELLLTHARIRVSLEGASQA